MPLPLTGVMRSVAWLLSRDLLKWSSSIQLIKSAVKIAPVWHPYLDNPDAACSIIGILGQNVCIDNVRITGTGVVQVYTRDRVILVPAGQVAEYGLDANFKAWSGLRGSPLSDLVLNDLSQHSHQGIDYYESERLFELPSGCHKNIVHKVFNKFAELGGWGKIDIPEAEWACRVIEELVNVRTAEKARQWLQRSYDCDWHIGPMHGDLHSRNLLIRDGKPVVIDLDRFTWNGVHVLDRIHFLVQEQAKSTGEPWFKVVKDSLSEGVIEDETAISVYQVLGKGNSLSNALRLYFLYRTGAEARPGIKWPQPWVGLVKKYALEII